MVYEIGNRIKDEKRDLTIIDKYMPNTNRRTWHYKYLCNDCGYDCSGGYYNGNKKAGKWYTSYLLDVRKLGCPCCNHKIVSPYINSIAATNPELSKYFLDDDDKKYTVLSNARRDLICPFCKTIKKNMTISSLFRQGIACPICSGKISIGERIVYYILSCFKVEFTKEFVFPNNKWRYDFYIPRFNTIVEIHGMQHYKQTTFGDLSTVQQNDINKEIFALNNGIKKYIVINAMKSDFDYIVNSISNSEFSNICDLSSIDWLEIRKTIFNKNIVKEICDYWEKNKNVTYAEMEKLFSFSEATIRKYLRTGYKLGWCHEDDRNKNCCLNNIYSRNHNISTPILHVPTSMYFRSVGLCSRLSEEVFGERVASSTIRYKATRSNETYKYITRREFNDAHCKGECCYGAPFEEKLLEIS